MKFDKPNIFLIMSDQHSKHVLGCYGNEIIRTPNLDRLAAEGMTFTDAYCPAPLCVPSRMSFMTSRTPSRNRVWNNDHILSSGETTWAHALGLAGYETSLIGRMHFKGPDQRHGFENRPIGEPSASHPGSPILGGPMWTKFPGTTAGQCRQSVEIAGSGHTHYQWFDEERTEAALEYLRGRSGGKTQRPFAAVLGYTLPHCPFVALKELFDYYYGCVDVPKIESDQPADIRKFRELRGILEPEIPAERIRIARAAYFGMVEHMDMHIGKVLDCLDETGLAENTLVIYCSDHGEMAGEHGCWWKSNYYEGSAGVPLIARLGGVVESGSTCNAVCNLTDLGATFADIADTQLEPAADGKTLWPTLNGNHPENWENKTFSELVDHKKSSVLPSRMIRSNKWKLWLTVNGPDPKPALFNLQDDPDELNDLGNDPNHADIRDKLLEELCDGWNPKQNRLASIDAVDSFRTLGDWGRTINPENPDAITVTSADYEADVELL